MGVIRAVSKAAIFPIDRVQFLLKINEPADDFRLVLRVFFDERRQLNFGKVELFRQVSVNSVS